MNRLRVPTKDDPCVVCGSVPTIKSHLIPRAVVGELRGDEPYVHVTEVDVPGSVYSQSGDSFYGLLCSEHERALSRFDDYGVRIVRKIEKLMSQMGEDQKGIELQNSSPSLFKGFVLACIWRAVWSLHGKKFGLSLGPYEKRIRRFLFEDEEFEEKYGAVYDGLDKTKRSSISYSVFFIVRRLAFCVISFTLASYTTI